MKEIATVSNALMVAGLGCVAVAGWWIHAAIGMVVVGVSLLVIGYGISLTNKPTEKATDK